MKNLKFTKMQGLGNDFVVVDFEEYKKSDVELSELAVKLCDRNFGVGADGLIVINPNPQNSADIGWFFYNSDGTIAQMCGNGMRCFARYVYDKGLIKTKSFKVDTLAGVIIPEIVGEKLVKVNMSKPILKPQKIPFKANNNLKYSLKVRDKNFALNAVSMGNPHCVIFTDDDTKKLALEYGRDIEINELFPEKTNVEFIKVLSRNEINLDVWERGCGITLACGTGACASVVAGILNDYLDNEVKVNLPGGQLIINWAGNKDNTDFDVFMTGEANYSFSGQIL